MSKLSEALALIARGADTILKREELQARLETGRPLREPHHGSHILPVSSLAMQQRAHRMRPLA